MTQVKSAQQAGRNLALRKRADERSLAQRRKEFAVQMRAMALSDLEAVSRRLKDLHTELERKDGRKWKQYELAQTLKIPPRTFQSWENGEVENSDGKGYDKMARYYSRRLGRKITRQWILFGHEATDVKSEAVSEAENNGASVNTDPDLLREVSDRIGALASSVARLESQVQELLLRIPEPNEESGDR